MMNVDRKPWLLMKRLSNWNPLASARDLMPAPLPASGPVPMIERKALGSPERRKLRARWRLEA